MINTPRQVVLSGDADAVDAAAARAEDAFAIEISVVERVPMHSPLFRSVANGFRGVLEAVRWRQPRRPYVSNVSGRIEPDATRAVFVDALSRHVCCTVRWRDCVEAIASAAPGATFVETGPKSVLTSFFGRKWFSPVRFATDAAANLDTLIERLLDGPDGSAAVAG
jgi:malonyl CoA-acyl carrier protein transacylase